MRELNWFEPGGGCTRNDLLELERSLGLTLPSDLEELLLSHSGATNPQLPPGVIPVIATGWGPYVCLRALGGGNSGVVYFRPGEDEPIIGIAGSFSELFDRLRVPEDEEDEREMRTAWSPWFPGQHPR